MADFKDKWLYYEENGRTMKGATFNPFFARPDEAEAGARIIWLSRRPDGRLRYPRCVRAHLDKILRLSPNALSNEDIQQLKYLQ